jgi:hypothetical protein
MSANIRRRLPFSASINPQQLQHFNPPLAATIDTKPYLLT